MNVLLIDIGNTRVKWGLSSLESFDLLSTGVFDCALDESSLADTIKQQWQDLAAPEYVSLSSVAGERLTEQIMAWLKQQWSTHVYVLTATKKMCGVVNAYLKPERLGSDRWAGLLAARSLYKRRSVCVVSCGTAMTIDVLRADGKHLGGYILPGYRLMSQALHLQTHALPQVHDSDVADDCVLQPGNDTEMAIANGVLLSQVAVIEHVMQQSLENGCADIACLMTSGGAQKLLHQISFSCDYQPHLVLKGLLLACAAQK